MEILLLNYYVAFLFSLMSFLLRKSAPYLWILLISSNLCLLLYSLNSIEELIKFAQLGKKVRLSICLDSHQRLLLCFFTFFFFFFKLQLLTILSWIVHRCTVYGSHKLHFSATFSLKNDPIVLFTHLKIILLQCFQFSVFSKNKLYPNGP